MKRRFTLGALIIILGVGTSISAQNSHPFPPSPIFSNLLSTVRLGRDGRLKPADIYAYFLTNEKGTLKIFHDGAEIAEFRFRSPRYSGVIYKITGYQLVRKTRDGFVLNLKKAGKYELAYYANGKKFYGFPFEVVIKPSADPYNPKKRFLLNGAWNDHAYLTTTRVGNWNFKLWVRSVDGKNKQSKGNIRLIRDKDKKLVAVGRTNFRTEGHWTRETFELQKPGKQNSNGEYYSNMEIRADRDKFEDGTYTLNFNLDGKLYGTYKFSVKNGKVQYQGNQIRETTTPLHYIEGGTDSFWLIRS